MKKLVFFLTCLPLILAVTIPAWGNDPPVITLSGDLEIAGCSLDDIVDSGLSALPFSEESVSISREQLQAEGGAIAHDCPIASIVYADEIIEDDCPWIVHRTFLVKDECGNEASAVQQITIKAPPIELNNHGGGYGFHTCGDDYWVYYEIEYIVGEITRNAIKSGGCDPVVVNDYDMWSYCCFECSDYSFEVTWTITDQCEEISFSVWFEVYSGWLEIQSPNSVAYHACSFKNQRELDAAFAYWMCGFTIWDDCGWLGDLDLRQYSAPDLSAGGVTEVEIYVSEYCWHYDIKRTFEVIPADESGCAPGIKYADLYIEQPGVDDCMGATRVIEPDDVAGWVLVYPNPGSGIFNLEAGSLRMGDRLSVQVFDLEGREVHRALTLVRSDWMNIRLNLSFLGKGVYFLQVQDGTRRTIQQIIIL